MYRRSAFFFSAGLLLLLAASRPALAQEYRIAPVPDWVSHEAADLGASVPRNQASDGTYYLLIDNQARVEGAQHAHFTRRVIRILNEAGLREVSTVSADFDPEYESLTLHDVSVHREGVRSSRLQRKNVRVLRREQGLEEQIYDGRKTADIVLDDLRVGDVVEYSYTVRGANPIFNGRYGGAFYTAYSVPVHRYRNRLLWPASRTLHVRRYGSAPEPRTSDAGGYVEYRWAQDHVPPVQVERGVPGWYEPYPWVQVSEWSDWAEVVRWAGPLYKPDLGAVRSLAAEIGARANTPEGRLLAALRFTQDDIRYLGYEMGSGSHEPRAPGIILQQRFGDCKDKSRLLVSLLNALGIEAYPALVHTRWTDELSGFLPTPYVFNHVIVVAYLGGRPYWMDPTQRLQRGDLEHFSEPDYGMALPVRAGTRALVAMDPPRREGPDKEIEETFDLRAGLTDTAAYTVRTMYVGAEADGMRERMAWQSRAEMATTYLDYYAGAYPGIEAADTLAVYDNPVLNQITVIERYRIPELWTRDEEAGRSAASFYAMETEALLERPNAARRTMPLSMGNLFHQIHRVRVLLPESWNVRDEKVKVEDDAMLFESDVSYDDQEITMRYEYRTKADHLAPEKVAAHLRNVEKAEQNIGYEISNTDTGGEATGAPNWPVILLGVLAAGISAYLALKVYRYEPPGHPLAPEERSPHLTGLSGWLIVVGLGVVIQPFAVAVVLVEVLEAASLENWSVLTGPQSSAYHPLWAPALLFEVVANAVMMVLAIPVAVLFFRRRFSFPTVYCAYLGVYSVIVVADTALTASLPNVGTGSSYAEAAGNVISSLIWIAYCQTSRRVKSTFVTRLTDEPQSSLALAIERQA